jgi:acetoin utilization deacetylase AcuC-like enzyme
LIEDISLTIDFKHNFRFVRIPGQLTDPVSERNNAPIRFFALRGGSPLATALITDPRFLDHETGAHPETPLRLEAIEGALEDDSQLWDRLEHAVPRSASEDEIARCHSRHLIEDIREAAASGVERLDADTVISRESFEVARLAAGAAITAVDLVMGDEGDNVFAAVRPPDHHAGTEVAMGFCLFNNAASAARYAQVVHDLERVLVIDWDVHHGNGTQEIFYRDPTVFYFSTHQYPFYPGTGARTEAGEGPGEGSILKVPLRAATLASDHREAFEDALSRIEDQFPPDLIIISAGFDSRRDDPLGGLLLGDTDFAEMTKEVLDVADRHAGALCANVSETPH